MSKSFLQSKEWAKFQESLGRKVFIIEDKLVIKYGLPLGLSYLYSPRPFFAESKNFNKFLRETQKIAGQENAVFLKIEPNLIENLSINNSMKIENCKLKIVDNIQPQNTLVLDPTKPLDKLLGEMHPKTRYNIRLAERHNLKIKKSVDVNDVGIFWQLALKTSRRDGFSYHPKHYYQKMIEVLGRENKGTRGLKGKLGSKGKLEVVLFIAMGQFNNLTLRLHSGQAMIPLAAILVLFYQDTAIYLHGASDHNYRNFMAPFLLQWQAIKEAKKRGCKTYDFWGVAPNNGAINHPWAGITRFKTGFSPNGEIVNYPPCYDIVYQRFWYLLYKMTKRIRGK